MAIAGPRLDRPSAVGDEGRPRAASLTVAAAVVVGLAVVALVLLDALQAMTLLGLSVTLVVAGMALLGRDRFGQQVVGHLLYHPGAVLVVVLVVSTVGASEGLLVIGLFVALFGVAAAWANALVEDDLQEATVAAATSYGATLGWFVALIVALWFASGTWTLAVGLAGTADPVDSLFGFLGLLAAAGFLVRSAIWALPIAALTPRSRRQARRIRLSRYGRAGTAVAIGAVGLLLAVSILVGTRTVHRVANANPVVEGLLVGLSSPLVLVPVVAACAVGAILTAVGWGARSVAAHVDAGNDRFLAGAVAGLFFALLIVGYLSELLIGLLVFLPTLLGLAAMDGGILPARAAGPALAATGTFVAGIGAALAGLPGVLVFAFVAGVVVVWDVSTFGLGLTVELGHRPETRRLELYHAVLSVGVGLAAVVVAGGLDLGRRTVGAEMGAWPAVGLAVLGAIALAVAVARREA